MCLRGWVQECPGEPAMCVGCLSVSTPGKTEIYVCSVYGDTPEQAQAAAEEIFRLKEPLIPKLDKVATERR